MNFTPHIENAQRQAIILTAVSFIALIILAMLNQVWFLAGVEALMFALWVTFSIALNKNRYQWTNLVFIGLSTGGVLLALYPVSLLWLVPVLLCALAGWDLMHLHLRTTHIENEQTTHLLNAILKQHYHRLALAGGISLFALMLVNGINLNLHFGWTLLFLFLAGISIGFILRWVRKRYH